MDAGCYPHRMASPARGPATYDDLLAVPDHLVAEIVDGELYTSARPAPRHAELAVNLAGAMSLFLVATSEARRGVNSPGHG